MASERIHFPKAVCAAVAAFAINLMEVAGALGDDGIPAAPLSCGGHRPTFEDLDGPGKVKWQPLGVGASSDILIIGGLSGNMKIFAETVDYVMDKHRWKFVSLNKTPRGL